MSEITCRLPYGLTDPTINTVKEALWWTWRQWTVTAESDTPWTKDYFTGRYWREECACCTLVAVVYGLPVAEAGCHCFVVCPCRALWAKGDYFVSQYCWSSGSPYRSWMQLVRAHAVLEYSVSDVKNMCKYAQQIADGALELLKKEAWKP